MNNYQLVLVFPELVILMNVCPLLLFLLLLILLLLILLLLLLLLLLSLSIYFNLA